MPSRKGSTAVAVSRPLWRKLTQTLLRLRVRRLLAKQEQLRLRQESLERKLLRLLPPVPLPQLLPQLLPPVPEVQRKQRLPELALKPSQSATSKTQPGNELSLTS